MTPELGSSIEVRRLRFELPERLDPNTIADELGASRMFVGLSLAVAYLEPYLVRTMQSAKPHVTDAALCQAITLFNGQEGQHFRQHMSFNEAIRRHGHDEALHELERELERDYRSFSETRSLRFNLAYAEGFEALTTAVSRFAFQIRLDERLHPEIRDLFRWHAVEELEHRVVAFDVYEHVQAGYLYRLGVGLFAQWHLLRFVHRAMGILAQTQPALAKPVEPSTAARPSLLWLAILHLLPKVLATYMPWYTPHAIDMPDVASTFAQQYSELARVTAMQRSV
ncbi:MAG: hypothetical protein JWN04_2786 [Myxococcaceae bacterium]|nr:hypothetical protein [Myxococcaceae bacterium]